MVGSGTADFSTPGITVVYIPLFVTDHKPLIASSEPFVQKLLENNVSPLIFLPSPDETSLFT
jgi:hypothetical protein